MQPIQNHQFERFPAGVDEAGRGPLAGPVVAAAVILDPQRQPAGLRDSKVLSAAVRERLAEQIRQSSVAWAIGWADRAEIDTLNILHATMLAMRRAVLGLAIAPTAVLVDGNRLPCLDFHTRRLRGSAIVRGDAKIAAISAASILAKTARDNMMIEMDRLYPNYAFAKHKGYGTKIHRQRLQMYGPCEQHRQSFTLKKSAV